MWSTNDTPSRRIDFEVDTEPTPWQRPRANHGTGRYFVDRRSQRCRDAIRAAAFPHGSIGLAACRAIIEIRVDRPARPAWWFPSRFDVDNAAKQVLDAVNGISFADDRQIVELRARKRYCRDGEMPGYRVRIDEIAEFCYCDGAEAV